MELAAAEQCVEFLLNVRNHDKTQHSAVAVPDVRRLYAQLRGNIAPTASDPGLYTGVLQAALKDMTPCLLSCVYDSLLLFDTLDEKDGATRLISFMRGVLIKLPDRLFTLFQQICEVLCKSTQTTTCVQLAANISPYICRPKGGAFMSIRHMEDLRRLRPAIQFILENYTDVFDKLVSEETMLLGSSVGSHQNVRIGIDLSMQNMHIKKKVDVDSIDVQQSHVGSTDYTHKANRSHDYDSIEWKILEGLVSAKIKAFLSAPEGPLRFAYSISRDEQDEQQVKVESAVISSNTTERLPKSEAPDRTASVPSQRVSLLTSRRQIIAECKTVKGQIAIFEQEYKDMHNSFPKDGERGEMEPVYRSYRTMKRKIRSNAATDIQRMYRGLFVRKQIEALKTQIQCVPMDTAAYELDGDFICDSESDSDDDFDTEDAGASQLRSSGEMRSVDSDDELIQEHLIGKLTNAISGVGFSSSGSLNARVQALLEAKQGIKEKLRAFDEAFLTARGQLPTKAEKEIMRPHYDQYRQVKIELRKMSARAQTVPPTLLTSKSDAGLHLAVKNGPQLGPRPQTVSTGRRNGADQSLMRGQENREILFEEKRQLHAFLKSYEKGFTKAHGRPVTHTDDIKAVSDQYKRYKELKSITKTMDGN